MFKKGETVYVKHTDGREFEAIVIQPFNGICVQVSAKNWEEIGCYRYNAPLENVKRESYV